MDRDRGDIAYGIHIPDFPEQLLLGKYMIGMLSQEGKEIEFLGGELLLSPVHPYAPCGLVYLESSDLYDVVVVLLTACKSFITAHMGLDPGHQL